MEEQSTRTGCFRNIMDALQVIVVIVAGIVICFALIQVPGKPVESIVGIVIVLIVAVILYKFIASFRIHRRL